jgi:hypothetical protein
MPARGQSSSRRASPAPEKAADAPPPTVPPRIFAQASPRSLGGVSLFDAQQLITSDTAPNFYSDEETMERAANRLQDTGFEILQVTPLTINIAGSQATYEQAFRTTIVAEERPVLKPPGATEATATFLDSPDTPISGLIATAGTTFEQVLEGVALEEPRYPLAASMFAPPKTYWHLRVPGDVSLGCNADRAHRAPVTGRGVKVVMVDSGWFKHPYFVGRGYRSSPVVLGPATANPLADEVGHGTGESANLFAVAPDVDFTMVKINFVNSIGAFNAAVGLQPHIISCSWGSSIQNGPLSAADQALAAAIAAAVAAGIIVVFSAGNGQWGFPGQHPDVISAGGVYMEPDGSLRATPYASGFTSNVYANRRVPDLCGLVGLPPGASYIMLPLEPADQIDTTRAGGTHPPNDETAANDGWAVFSGTSAAAPQLAGAAALIKEACAKLTPAEVKDILIKTARDVTAGNAAASTGGHPAGPGPDLATGAGLVDAHKAVTVAKVRCLGPIGPIAPVTPVQPIRPIQPIEPIRPIRPIIPIQPIRPIAPVVNPPPIASAVPAEAAPSGPPATGQLSAEDIQTLEEMILKDDVDLDL